MNYIITVVIKGKEKKIRNDSLTLVGLFYYAQFY